VENLTFEVLDATDMNTLEDNSFDAVIDKATLDAIICCDPSYGKAIALIKEVYRILARGGAYIIVSRSSKRSILLQLEM
jgi:ubiquinone/menaquinone biosynthesis C-methylase UbiE